MARNENIEWCKKRALEVLASGDNVAAIHSMLADLGMNTDTEELQSPAADKAEAIDANDAETVKKWIEAIEANG